ncbi:MAG: hypothetical protein KJT03_13595 [Verrucomicrobiae bacterium]|nr:hypothetical protein [Verrucomicrobiae bacterium]
MPPSYEASIAEPVRYIGSLQPVKETFHGNLPHAVGVHRFQAFRANRTQAPEGGNIGWTYNHAPMLAYWKNRFWLQYVSNLTGEHNPPGRDMILSSADGIHWTNPQVAFPAMQLPEIDLPDALYGDMPNLATGTYAILHQRMGFYVAPNDRLLTLGFYSYSPTTRYGPNHGQGIGRVVREVYADGSMGPIYYLRYNREMGWNESTAPRFSFYRESEDAGFLEACEALLADKLMTAQWWEEDRATDGFFTLPIREDIDPKAFNAFQRPDGVWVGLWKSQLAALSRDRGLTWSKFGRIPTLNLAGSKVWGQQADDGRYALVYNHSASMRNRWPTVVITSEDGYHFDNMLAVHVDVPQMRYQGIHKAKGPQYFRGIFPGNGNPPGDHLWVTYSQNKEDIWVTRIAVPVRGEVEEHLKENFNLLSSVTDLQNWNLYQLQWASAAIENNRSLADSPYLVLRDEEPHDYAKAEAFFPQSSRVRVAFKVYQRQIGQGTLEVEVQGPRNERPLRVRFDEEWVGFDEGSAEPDALPFSSGRWHTVEMEIDCSRSSYSVLIDGRHRLKDIEFANPAETVQRIVFRTGPWRMDVRPFLIPGAPGNNGLFQEDLAGADYKSNLTEYLIDDLVTSSF